MLSVPSPDNLRRDKREHAMRGAMRGVPRMTHEVTRESRGAPCSLVSLMQCRSVEMGKFNLQLLGIKAAVH